MIQDQDFLIRQIKSMAKGLGKFMGKEQIKEVLNLDEQGMLADDEFESILVMSKIESILYNAQLSFADLSEALDIKTDRLRDLINNKDYASPDELRQMKTFIAKNEEYV